MSNIKKPDYEVYQWKVRDTFLTVYTLEKIYGNIKVKDVILAKKLGDVRKAFINTTQSHCKHHRGLQINKKIKLMATQMLVFKDNSLIDCQALKAWSNQVLIKGSLDVISGINIKRKWSECVLDDIRNNKHHNQILNSW